MEEGWTRGGAVVTPGHSGAEAIWRCNTVLLESRPRGSARGSPASGGSRTESDAHTSQAFTTQKMGLLAHLRLSSMAGTSAGMCGRSSSGPAAAASLQVVSSASACTSGTWEGKPAGGNGEGLGGRVMGRVGDEEWHPSMQLA